MDRRLKIRYKMMIIEEMTIPVLSVRLKEISKALLEHKGSKTALEIFGEIDAVKVRSCMTLFEAVCPNDVFSEVLDAFYDGQEDPVTSELLANE
ncbi:MAG: DUF1810 family protein [Candidatus Cryptobacteroides sp.]